METVKHTPGPWTLSTREGKPASKICGSDAISIVKSDGPMTGYIACMVATGHHTKKLANARLIAAAPELLDVVKPLLEAYWNMAQMLQTDLQFQGDQLTQRTEAAIKKAEKED